MRFPNRRIHAAPLLAALLLSCSDNGVSPWAPGLRRELTAADYAVYSTWLRAYRPREGGTVLVDDRTTSTGYPGLSLVSREWGGLVLHPQPLEPPPPACPPNQVCLPTPIPAPSPPTGDEATEDYWLQRELSLPLERRLDGAVYDLVRDPIPEDLLSSARLVLSFSRVGFDSEVRVATFQVAQAARGDWSWLSPVHYTVRAEKLEGRWVLVLVSELESMQANGIHPPPVPDPGVVAIGTPPTTTVRGCRTSRLPHVGFCVRAVTGPGP